MTELELGVIIFALDNAHNFTYGTDLITFYTHLAPLVGLLKKCLDEVPNPRLTSLFEKIIHIKHIRGEDNVPACVQTRLAHS